MKIKRFVSLLLSLVLIMMVVNIGYAEDDSIDNNNTEIVIPDKILSDSPVADNTEENNGDIPKEDAIVENIVDSDIEDLDRKSDTDIAYQDENIIGGCIYFNNYCILSK